MTHFDHILLGLIVGGGGFLWRVVQDGLAQSATLKVAKNDIEIGIREAEQDRAEVEEEADRIRENLDKALSELETVTAEYDELMRATRS